MLVYEAVFFDSSTQASTTCLDLSWQGDSVEQHEAHQLAVPENGAHECIVIEHADAIHMFVMTCTSVDTLQNKHISPGNCKVQHIIQSSGINIDICFALHDRIALVVAKRF